VYGAVLIEMLAESRLAEVAAAAERRGTQHKPEGDPRRLVPFAANEDRVPDPTCHVPRALITFGDAVRALRTKRWTAVETR
jgi:hypothetical protein